MNATYETAVKGNVFHLLQRTMLLPVCILDKMDSRKHAVTGSTDIYQIMLIEKENGQKIKAGRRPEKLPPPPRRGS